MTLEPLRVDDLDVQGPLLPPPPVPVKNGIPAYGLVGSPLSTSVWKPTARDTAVFSFGALLGLLAGLFLRRKL